MKKFLIIVVVLNSMLWFGLSSLAKASDYHKAVLGHVVQATANGTKVDTTKLLEQEMQRLTHQFAIESITILQAYLPAILEGISADLRLKADKQYKCKLLKNSSIKDDCK